MATTAAIVATHHAVTHDEHDDASTEEKEAPGERAVSPRRGCCSLLLDSDAHLNDFEDDPDEPSYRPTSTAQKVFLILEDPNYNGTAQLVSIFILLLIVLGCITYVMESMRAFQYVKARCDRWDPSDGECEPVAKPIFGVIEGACMLVFTAEYIMRIVLVGLVPEQCWNMKATEKNSCLKKMYSYGKLPMNVVDLVAILPFWIKMLGLTKNGFGVLRIVRLARVLRMLRNPKIASSIAVFGNAMYQSSPALGILFFFSMMAFVLAGSIIFMFERGTFRTDLIDLCRRDLNDATPHGCFIRQTVDGLQLEASPYVNIPISMYWVVVTMTTTGYGDLYPTSTGGRIISILVVYCGIIAIALPITVIGTNFTREYDAHREREKRQAERKKLRWKKPLLRMAKKEGGKVVPAAVSPAKNPDRELLDKLRATLHQQTLGLQDLAAQVEAVGARLPKT